MYDDTRPGDTRPGEIQPDETQPGAGPAEMRPTYATQPGFDTPPPSAPRPSAIRFVFFGPEGLRAGWGLLLFYLLFAVFSQTAQAFLVAFGPHQPSGASRAGTPLGMLLPEILLFTATALATLILSRIERRPFGAFGLGHTRSAPRQFSLGLLWGLLFLSLLAAILWKSGALVFDGRLLFGSDVLRFGVAWAVVFLFVGLFEEFLLRGYLQFTLTRGIHALLSFATRRTAPAAEDPSLTRDPSPKLTPVAFWLAALLLSFIFGLGHHTNPGESPIGLLTAGLAGLLFCLALWRSGSLWWAIGFHASWDWAQSFLYGVPDSGILVRFHLLGSHPIGQPLVSGGLTGPEGSVYALPVMAAAAAVILLTLPRRAIQSGYERTPE